MILRQKVSGMLDKIYSKRCFVKNVFNQNYGKSVLISYITIPFTGKKSLAYHSNIAEMKKIAELFNAAGYNVDVVRHDCNLEDVSGLRANYDLLFGIEPNFINLAKKYPESKKIYYGTGAYCGFQNKAEAERIRQLGKRRAVDLERRRVVLEHESSDLADAVILIGNDWTKSTYSGHAKKVETIHVSAVSVFSGSEIIESRDWSSAKKKFLWFGSVGAVHKGLDLILEIFPKHPDLELYICGAVDREKDFVQLYDKELLQTGNIHYIGWIDPTSSKFEGIIKDCAYSILPSCSEGMSGSIATCMHGGMVPLVSRESGLDVESCGFIFKDNSIETIEETLQNAATLSNEETKKLALKSVDFASENFTLDRFVKDFKSALGRLL